MLRVKGRVLRWVGGAAVLGACVVLSPGLSSAAGVSETEIRYLSGTGKDDAVAWDFFCTGGRMSGAWSRIRVPSCWEQEGFGIYNYGVVFHKKGDDPAGLAKEQGRYRHEFTAPAEWGGRTVRLVFEGVMTDAEVKVNGRSAGPVHQGAFYRFKYDVTGLLKLGETNLLEVTVGKESANKSVNEAERRGDYWNFGGIFRPVYLEALPTQSIDRVAIDARADGSFVAQIALGSATMSRRRLEARILDASGAAVGAPFGVDVPPRAERAVMRTRIADPRLWTAETPHLYRVRIALSERGLERHVTSATFGFRTFEVRPGDGLYLNDRKIVLKGVNRHSFWPESGRTLSREQNYADARLMKEMNMDAVRMSHYPPDGDFLDACDELGLYVLDELGGWHAAYDTAVGRTLVGEMVRRDVNHPSVLLWDNGNEGGWNTELDGEFAKWDPQGRVVLHPWETFGAINTAHYRSYGETQEHLRRPTIFMPTEFLHGLYDGGHGAGLWDYWELMRRHPRSAGGFLWVFADEGVVRTDENGRIDNVGNYGADGIVGPHHEREGSFNTIREVWSPIQIGPERLPADFSGGLRVENRYDFTNLERCTFAWELARFARAEDGRAGHTRIAEGEVSGPSVAPRAAGAVQLPLPTGWRDADVLYVTAKNPEGQPLWTWSWDWQKEGNVLSLSTAAAFNDTGGELVVTAGPLSLRFDRATGELAGVGQGARTFALGHGPRFVAARRGDRTLDGTVSCGLAKGIDRVYGDVSGQSPLLRIGARRDGEAVIVEAEYGGPLRRARWTIGGDGAVRLDYEYAYEGIVELMGIAFDYPEANVQSLRWLGRGPYRVWQNRLHGTTLDVWENAYNDPVPGESFSYPEFKGYFRDWRWARFETTEGVITVGNDAPGGFLGVFTPRDGRDALLYTLPPTGIAALDVIPAVRNKVNATDLVGPSSQPQRVSGARRGTLRFRFE
jgi:hypothetical protein